MRGARPHGVPLWSVGAGLLVAGALLAGLVGLTGALRPPVPEVPALPSADPGRVDPRIDIECAEPEPSEGEQDDEDQARSEGPSAEQPAPLGAAGEPVPVTSADLLDCPESYDLALVSFQGELVGTPMERDGGVWVRLNDDPYARELGPLPTHRGHRGPNEGVTVRLPPGVAERIATAGGPGRQGDVVEVTGLFQRVDEDTGDMAVIHGRDGEVVRSGGDVERPSAPGLRQAAVLLSGLAAGLVAAERISARRRRLG